MCASRTCGVSWRDASGGISGGSEVGERWVKPGPPQVLPIFRSHRCHIPTGKRLVRIANVRVGTHRERREVGHVASLQGESASVILSTSSEQATNAGYLERRQGAAKWMGGWGLGDETPAPWPSGPWDVMHHRDRSRRRSAFNEPGHAHELTFSSYRRY